MVSGKGQILDFAILNHDDRLLASIVSGHLEEIYTVRPKGSTKSPLRTQSDLELTGGLMEAQVLVNLPGVRQAEQELAGHARK
jgi:hypothetical protein